MVNFLIQTVENQIVDDFSFHLIQSINWLKWWNKKEVFGYTLTNGKLTPDKVPIGSVEFVVNYLNTYFNLNPTPINVPQILFPYANRDIKNGSNSDISKK